MKKSRGKLVKITEEVIADARAVQAELELLQEKPPLVNRLNEQLGEWIEAAEKVVRQTQEVIKGNRHLPRRLVSLFDVDARPIKRGKSRTDTEFGRKVLLGETDHGIITTYQVLQDNPSDTTLLKPAVKGHRRLFRKRLKAVAADRGFYSQPNEDWLKNSGVKRVGIPKRGKVKEGRRKYQEQSWFKRLQRFRAGIAARISLLKRKFGLKRSRMRGSPRVNIWEEKASGYSNRGRTCLPTGFPLVFQGELNNWLISRWLHKALHLTLENCIGNSPEPSFSLSHAC